MSALVGPARPQFTAAEAGALLMQPRMRLASDGATMWDFSTLTGYSVNNSGAMQLVDSPLVSERLGKETAKSIQFTIPAGTNSELSFPAITAPQIPGQSISLVVEMTAGDTGGSNALVNLFIGTDGTYANSVLRSDQLSQYGVIVLAPVQGSAMQQWSATGTPNWSGWTRGKLRITAGTSQAVVIVHAVLAAQSCPPAICLIHDDNDITAISELRPRLDRYGFKAGFAVISDLVGTNGFMSWSQIDRLYQEGHDLHAHGQFNLNTFASASLAQADILKNRNALLDRGYTRGSDIYVYPNGNSEYSAADRYSIRDYLKTLGYRAAFRSGGTAFHPSGRGVGALDLPRYALNSTINTTTFFNALDSSVQSGRAMCGMLHVVQPASATGSDITRANIDAVLAGLETRRASGLLRIVSPSELVGLMNISSW